MSSYVISCCSTADLTEEQFSKREISDICFHYKLNDHEYADDLGKSMPFDQFYAAMAAGASTKTSQVNADEFEAYFETFLQDGKDILHVCLSSGISGVLNSAMIAKADLEDSRQSRARSMKAWAAAMRPISASRVLCGRGSMRELRTLWIPSASESWFSRAGN